MWYAPPIVRKENLGFGGADSSSDGVSVTMVELSSSGTRILSLTVSLLINDDLRRLRMVSRARFMVRMGMMLDCEREPSVIE